jgi:AP-3 complex subunit beta
VIAPVVVLAIRACARDPSPAVRKAAAHAVPKIYRLERAREDELVEIIETLLRDSSPVVLSSATAAFLEVCPHRMDLLHAHYRKLCCLLVDTDEWGQALLTGLLLRYARTQFLPPDGVRREPLAGASDEEIEIEIETESGVLSPPSLSVSAPVSERPREDPTAAVLASPEAFYASESPAAANPAPVESERAAHPPPTPRREGELDEDHRLLLHCARPLLQSRNAAVLLSVATLHWYLAPAAELPRVAKALVFALRSSPESAHVLLQAVCAMARLQPALFSPHIAAFFAAPRDCHAVRSLKLDALTRCALPRHADRLMSELTLCLRDASTPHVLLAIRAVGRLAARMPSLAAACVRSLLELSAHHGEGVAAEAVLVLRVLVQRSPGTHGSVVLRLVKRLDGTKAAAARAAVVCWLACADLPGMPAEEAARLAAAAPHALRLVMRTFTEEAEVTKLALLSAAARLVLRHREEGAVLLYAHLLSLSDADSSFDVRDRSRLLRALLPPSPVVAPSPAQLLAEPLLRPPMPPPPLPSPAELNCAYSLNSLSLAVQHTAPGYAPLPAHPDVPPPSSLRAAPVRSISNAAASVAAGPARGVVGGEGGFYSDSGESEGESEGSYSYSEESYEEEESGGESGEESEEVNDPSAWGAVPEGGAAAEAAAEETAAAEEKDESE